MDLTNEKECVKKCVLKCVSLEFLIGLNIHYLFNKSKKIKSCL